MISKIIIAKNVERMLPVVTTTVGGEYVVLDNRVANFQRHSYGCDQSKYFAVHKETGLILPVPKGIVQHTQKTALAVAQIVEDSGVFNAVTGKPIRDKHRRAQIIATVENYQP